MSELSLIKRFRQDCPTHPWIKAGPGHDCAILSWPGDKDLAYKIDQIVENVHFLLSGPSAAMPDQIGWKAMAKACSDCAAAGAWPVAATVAVNLRPGLNDEFAMGLYHGITRCCKQFGFALAGGDLSSGGPALTVCVSLLGEAQAGSYWLRKGAKPGDLLAVTGALGGSIAGKHLSFTPRLEEAKELKRIFGPQIHACIDITDGLSRDLQHICEESEVGAELDEKLIPASEAAKKLTDKPPIEHVLGDGEDFELLLSLDPGVKIQDWKHATPLTIIGRVLGAEKGLSIVGLDGKSRPLPNLGYEHKT